MVLEVHRCLRRRAERPRVEQSAVRCHSLGPCGRLSRSGSPGRRRAMPVSWARTSETALGVATIDDPVAAGQRQGGTLSVEPQGQRLVARLSGPWTLATVLACDVA